MIIIILPYIVFELDIVNQVIIDTVVELIDLFNLNIEAGMSDYLWTVMISKLGLYFSTVGLMIFFLLNRSSILFWACIAFDFYLNVPYPVAASIILLIMITKKARTYLNTNSHDLKTDV